MNEKARFYSQESGQIAQVEYADKKRKGEYRDPTLADAKKSEGDFKPSVTTVLTALRMSFSMLYYLKEQCIKAALREAHEHYDYADPGELEHDPSFIKQVMRAADEHGREAAEKGTSIHAAAAEMIVNGTIEPQWEKQLESIRLALGAVASVAEFDCEHALVGNDYAGTPDIVAYHNDPGLITLIDLKTQEIVPDHPRKKDFQFYDEWCYQLAAYRQLITDNLDRRCVSTGPDNGSWERVTRTHFASVHASLIL